MRLVAVRGRAMAAAAATEPTGMTAVLGGDQEAVLATIARHGLTPANVNAAGQIVAAGTLAELDAFAADPPAGARLRPLQVAGAFHTRHMAPAVAALRDAAADVAVADPTPTEPRSPPARSGWSASSLRSPRRCAGICACGPWPTSA
jgi:[acyl-carrier-protein] S-malonyltransferase